MHVLVAEDEPSICELICELLEAYGLPVMAVGSADEAVRYFNQHCDEIKLVITDVRMPGLLDGYDLARIVQANKPNTPILVTSGYEGRPRLTAPTGIIFLAQPWNLDQFDSLVRRYL